MADSLDIVHIPRRFTLSSWGGTETVVLETAREELRRGHHPRILTTQALDKHEREVIDGVPVERFTYFYPFLGLSEGAQDQMDKKGGNLVSFPLLNALMRGNRPDVIHLHTGKRLGGIARFAARWRKIPYVITLHGGLFDVPAQETESLVAPAKGALEWGKALGYLLGSRRVLADAAAILCVGEAEARQAQAHYPRVRVLHTPNGVAAERFATGDGAGFRQRHGIPTSDPVVLCVGRIDPQKNQLLLVDVLAQLRTRTARLVMLGPVTGQGYDQLIKNKVRELELESRVHLLPAATPGSTELLDAYHAADVFALPSRHEPFGIVILEAWAAGLPVVATRVGGIPSFVRDGEDGLLVEPQNASELAHAIDQLLASKELRAELGAKGKARASGEFSWQRRTDQLLALYGEVIRSAAGR
jgi:glycosyltransferase involved in cell wall biosynthesis